MNGTRIIRALQCTGLNGKSLRFRRDGPFLKRLVTCDEKWIFYDNVIRKRQRCRPGGGTKTYSKEKSALQKINDLCLVGYARDYTSSYDPTKP
jgi:hypothetical protein